MLLLIIPGILFWIRYAFAQQAVIIGKMVLDLDFPVEIRVMPTVRETDGLAMSSRNTYLSKEDRKTALCLIRSLAHAAEEYIEGKRPVMEIIFRASEAIIQEGVDLDYLSIVDPATLKDVETTGKDVIIAAAIYIGKVRLIDNVVVRNGKLSL